MICPFSDILVAGRLTRNSERHLRSSGNSSGPACCFCHIDLRVDEWTRESRRECVSQHTSRPAARTQSRLGHIFKTRSTGTFSSLHSISPANSVLCFPSEESELERLRTRFSKRASPPEPSTSLIGELLQSRAGSQLIRIKETAIWTLTGVILLMTNDVFEILSFTSNV